MTALLKTGGGMPTGQIIDWPHDSLPPGFLLCDGSAVSRTAYKKLFNAIGTTHGAGDGSTTFNLPERRGEFVRGLDNGRGVDSGRSVGQKQGDLYRSHSHGASGSAGSTGAGGTDTIRGSGGFSDPYVVKAGSHSHSVSVNVNSAGSSETRPRNDSTNYVIKYK